MKKLTKPITTAILTAALLITSIGTGSFATTPLTVNAATTTDTFVDGGTITLKKGDVKKLLVNENNKDVTSNYKWSSSDTSIVEIDDDFYDETKDYTECIVLTANKTGTATITGKYKYSGQEWHGTTRYAEKPDLTMTVTVKQPKVKMTAKQKRCKHKYKTTKKATCEREGVKTCKKCKWQVTLKTTNHKWIDTEVTSYEHTELHMRAMCAGCYCTDIPKGYAGCDWHNYTNTICKTHPCDKTWNTEEYGSEENMWKAINEHLANDGCNGTLGAVHSGTYYGGPEIEVTKNVTICDYCGIEKK